LLNTDVNKTAILDLLVAMVSNLAAVASSQILTYWLVQQNL